MTKKLNRDRLNKNDLLFSIDMINKIEDFYRQNEVETTVLYNTKIRTFEVVFKNPTSECNLPDLPQEITDKLPKIQEV